MQRQNSQLPLPEHDEVAGSCSSKKLEVFINHRGPDTEKNSAVHIYDILKDKGVPVFVDPLEFEGGDSLPDVIEEAIHSAKVHVCIFSSGYAESVWCLKDLEMILHRYEMGKSVLIPIFYDVKPSEVRCLKGSLGQGFQKHSCIYSNQVMHRWRNALRKSSNISGYEGQGDKCREVFNKICKQLEVGSVQTPEKVIGIEERLLSVKDDIMR